jgi:hypothetical protein
VYSLVETMLEGTGDNGHTSLHRLAQLWAHRF